MVMTSEYSTGMIRASLLAVPTRLVLVLAPLAQLLPGDIGKYVHAYLPSEAGQLITYAHAPPDAVLTPWQGFGVFCLWTAVLLAAAGYLLRRRDA